MAYQEATDRPAALLHPTWGKVDLVSVRRPFAG
jgi:hypothetical protein